jgi:uncharacterized protein (DUF58 family)
MGERPRQSGWRWLISWLLPAGPPLRWRWWLPGEGRCWLLLTVLFTTIGLVKGINLLLLFGYLMLVIWGLNALAVGSRLPRLRLRRHVEEPVFAGSPCTVEVNIVGSARPVRGLRIEDVGPDHDPATWFLPRLGSTEVTLRATTIFHHRGLSPPGDLAVVRGYPFGLVFRRVSLLVTEGVVVLPRLGWVHSGRLRQLLRHASPQDDCVRRHRPQRHPSAQAEFHGLRPWRAGDSPRSIHWRTSARCGELMVREFEDEPSDNLILVFDPTTGNDASAAACFEEAVSLAATICWAWCRQKGERLILAIASADTAILDDAPGPSHARQVLQALALVASGPAADGQALAQRLVGFADIPAACVVIAAGDSPLTGQVAAALRRQVVGISPRGPEVEDFYEPPADWPGQVTSIQAPSARGSTDLAGMQDAGVAGAVVHSPGKFQARDA